MADPVSMGLQAAGGLVKGVAGYKAGRANKKAFYADAIEQEKAGNAQAIQVRDQARQVIGNQVAAQFSNGFQGGTGSALDALGESQINATLDMLQVRRDAASKAMSARAQGDQALQQGKFALLSGVIEAGSSISSGIHDWAAAKKGTTAPAPKGK